MEVDELADDIEASKKLESLKRNDSRRHFLDILFLLPYENYLQS